MHEETFSFTLLAFFGKCIMLGSRQFPSLILCSVEGSSRANHFDLIGMSFSANP
jgi:hypothetical protein